MASGLPHAGATRPRSPRRLAALVVLVSVITREDVSLSDTHSGRVLRAHFDRRLLGLVPRNRLCRGVLVLPTRHADYLRGRRRQALRTNLRRAARAGIRCELTHEPAVALAAASDVLHGRRSPLTAADVRSLRDSWPALFAAPETTLLVARDCHGAALATMAAVIDEEVCLIRVAVASSHEARWALHDHLVRILISRGARYLLTEGGGMFGALGFGAEVHHYQHLLGYELRHVRPRASPLVDPTVTSASAPGGTLRAAQRPETSLAAPPHRP